MQFLKVFDFYSHVFFLFSKMISFFLWVKTSSWFFPYGYGFGLSLYARALIKRF